MIDISIIIVNYNVRHFLEQALHSIERAKQHLNVEVWVVDNNSVDDSITMVQNDFAHVSLILNKKNVGFSKANNQAIVQSTGKYVLLLNPDTVLQEDTLVKCFDYMEAHPKTGALGVKMIDGSGQFLPESKRGFPSPWVSFCKATGLSSLFKKSRVFNQYHLGFLEEDETHQIDVLCGAFMFMPKKTLDDVGLLDEQFFMYGEDIDLSYRIKSGGYDVVYLHETKIIHFKGESTKKASLNYVRIFYQAMIIFANKHYAGKGAGLFSLFLRLAIFARASVSVVKRSIQKIGPTLMDFLIGMGSFSLVSYCMSTYYHNNPTYYPNTVFYNFLIYTMVGISVLYFQGIYGKFKSLGKIIRSFSIAIVLALAIYGLLNAAFRSSRFVLLMGFGLFGILALIWRYIFTYLTTQQWALNINRTKRIIVVGTKEAYVRIKEQLDNSLINYKLIGAVAPQHVQDFDDFYITKWEKLPQFIEVEKIDEIIYSIQDLQWKDVMTSMHSIGPKVLYKMSGDDQISILGSQSKNTTGELYTIDFKYAIAQPKNRLSKRFIDMVLSIVMLLFSFLLVWFQKKSGRFFLNIFHVLIGRKTWVGYDIEYKLSTQLPILKPSILNRTSYYNQAMDPQLQMRINVLYAKSYTAWMDVETIFKNLNKLDS